MRKIFFKLNAVSAILTLLWVSSNFKAKKEHKKLHM